MTYIAHIFAALGLFIGSLFGASSPIPAPVATSSSVATQTQHTTHTQTPDPCTGAGDEQDVVLGSVVCSYGDVVKGADGKTFVTIRGNDDLHTTFAKDAHAVYSDDVVIPGADPATFTLLSYGYAKDKNSVYCGGGGDYPATFEALSGADPATFTVLGWSHVPGGDANFYNGRLAKDSKTAYSQCAAVANADPATFTPIYRDQKDGIISGYAKDTTHVWDLDGTGSCAKLNADGQCPVVNIPPDPMPGADPASFHLVVGILGYGDFGVDAAHIYRGSKIILPEADPSSFTIVKSSQGNGTAYEKDKSHVFFNDQVVVGADPTTFVALDCGDVLSDGEDDCTVHDSKDKNHSYLYGKIVE